MSYTVLARKYRPQTFSALIGQEHITRTLGNAIEGQRVAHAFLFTGVRGIGKTTTARLLAKALNCATGPSKEPCNQCDQCRQIADGNDLDVLEIDGASNNGVDDVRRLQETLPFRPTRDRFKIVIVDEVHMLSTGAFNAFLKTLEEPPAHVKFIFATTENHKVPLTIKSRCQNYDFRLIPDSVMIERIQEILQKEEISADAASIAMIARQAAGSMRDALTVLDQVVAFSGSTINVEQVTSCLGIADRNLVFEIAQALLDSKADQCVQGVNELSEKGLDILHFARQLLELLRDLVVMKVAGTDNHLHHLIGDELKRAKRITLTHSPQEIERAFTGLSNLVEQTARSGAPKIVFEIGLVRLADRPSLTSLETVITELDRFQSQLLWDPSSVKGTSSTNSGSSVKNSKRTDCNRTMDKDVSDVRKKDQQTKRHILNTIDSHDADQAANQAVASPNPTTGPIGSDETSTEWERIVDRLKDMNPALSAVLEHGIPVQISKDILKVAFREDSFFGLQVREESSRHAIIEAAKRVLGQSPDLQLIFSPNPDGLGISIAKIRSAQSKQELEKYKERALNHPRVKDALEVFPEAKNSLKVNIDVDPSRS